MKRLFLYLLLIAVALACYFVGFGEAIVVLIVAYLVLEVSLGSLLGRAFRGKQQRDS